MPTGGQIRGMVLEEVILRLLATAGYRTLDVADNITTFKGTAGLEVSGRGSRHQIDAIADYRLQQPFSHPQRLLLEAKCYRKGKDIGLEVIRNAIGVHKDSSEYWRGPSGSNSRFHYQYAVFSATEFSQDAEAYAFAQDIYLFPLRRSAHLQTVLEAIWAIKTGHMEKRARRLSGFMSNLRTHTRQALRETATGLPLLNDFLADFESSGAFDDVITEAQTIKGGLLASSRSGFLIFLVPPPRRQLGELIQIATNSTVRIRVRRVRNGWFWFMESNTGKELFTLDIPPELFRLYMSEDSKDTRAFIDIKRGEFSRLQAVYWSDGVPQILTFNLNRQWIRDIERKLERSRPQQG
jgi:hypothetical protein